MGDRSRLRTQQRDWEELAEFNPEWAVLTVPGTKFERWDLEEFFNSGSAQVASALAVGEEHGVPARRGAVLDFGCGVGRLAPELSATFERYVGVDIAEGMIARARELNAELSNCTFTVNADEDLVAFDEGTFDAVLSFLVLQHIPSRETIRSYLRDFARVLAPRGLIAIQLISHIPLRYRLRPRRRLYRVARALGISVERAHRIGLQSMMLQFLPEDEVLELLRGEGCTVLRSDTADAGRGTRSTTYYATKP